MAIERREASSDEVRGGNSNTALPVSSSDDADNKEARAGNRHAVAPRRSSNPPLPTNGSAGHAGVAGSVPMADRARRADPTFANRAQRSTATWGADGNYALPSREERAAARAAERGNVSLPQSGRTSTPALRATEQGVPARGGVSLPGRREPALGVSSEGNVDRTTPEELESVVISPYVDDSQVVTALPVNDNNEGVALPVSVDGVTALPVLFVDTGQVEGGIDEVEVGSVSDSVSVESVPRTQIEEDTALPVVGNSQGGSSRLVSGNGRRVALPGVRVGKPVTALPGNGNTGVVLPVIVSGVTALPANGNTGRRTALPGVRVQGVVPRVGLGAAVVPVVESVVEELIVPVAYTRARKDRARVEGIAAIDDNWQEAEDDIAAAKKEEAQATLAAQGFRVMERDIEILHFLARYRYALPSQVARRVGTSDKAAFIRLSKMAKASLIRKEVITRGQTLWTPLNAGLAIADIDMPAVGPGKIAVTTMAHELGLLNLGVELEIGGDNVLGEEGWPFHNRYLDDEETLVLGENVITTREVRQGQARWNKDKSRAQIIREHDEALEAWEPGEMTPELVPGNAGMFALYSDNYGDHTPDMVVARQRLDNGAPQSVAIELELSPKKLSDWRRTLLNFKESVMFDKLIYFTHKKSISDSLNKLNREEIGIDPENFKVRRYTPRKGGLPFWG